MRHGRHRQERWLHTRISETLEDALKREARRRRLPVSLLVRNVLEGAFELVEGIVESSLGVAPRAGASRRGGPGEPDDVYGWQEIVLNRATACVRCHAGLGVGTAAHRGLRDRGGPPVFLCPVCLGRLREPGADRKEDGRP